MMRCFFLLLMAGFLLSSCQQAGSSPQESTQFTDQKITLDAPDGRIIPLRILTPKTCSDCPFIFFSHGANAAYDRYDAILIPLAKAGFQVAAPNHVDSEEHLARDKFTPAESLPKRLEDYDIIVAHFAPTKLFSAGHSYGAMIAQLSGGAKLSGEASKMQTDATWRPEAVIALSPPGPIKGYMEPAGWAKISVPSLVTTGTTDIVPKMTENWEDHLAAFDAAPTGKAYALVYEDMDHYMNGAYGREKEIETEAMMKRERAISHLITSMSVFIKSGELNTSVAAERDFVELKKR